LQYITGFRGRPQRVKASKAWAMASREPKDWEEVAILGGIESRMVKQAAEELGAIWGSWNTFILPPDKIDELISKVRGESNYPQGADEESCPTSTMEGHLLPPPENKELPSESPLPEVSTGSGQREQ